MAGIPAPSDIWSSQTHPDLPSPYPQTYISARHYGLLLRYQQEKAEICGVAVNISTFTRIPRCDSRPRVGYPGWRCSWLYSVQPEIQWGGVLHKPRLLTFASFQIHLSTIFSQSGSETRLNKARINLSARHVPVKDCSLYGKQINKNESLK